MSLIGLISLIWFAQTAFAQTVDRQQTDIFRVDLSSEFSTTVSAKVGGYLFDIEGLTSPWARVEFFSSQDNVRLTTIADDQGVFHFVNALMPLVTGDFCFLATDIDQVTNAPLCFPPPSPSTKTSIRGIILPPSLSLEKDLFKQGETVAAFGRTVPSSEIKTYFFEDENPSLLELLDAFAPKLLSANDQYPNSKIQTISNEPISKLDLSNTTVIPAPLLSFRTNVRNLAPTLRRSVKNYAIARSFSRQRRDQDDASLSVIPATSPIIAGAFLSFRGFTRNLAERIFENLKLFRLSNLIKNCKLKIVNFPSVYAREGPPLKVIADSQGKFSFNLPSYKSTTWKLFVGTNLTQFGDNPSPQSNTLQFTSLSWWLWFLLTILTYILRALDWFFKIISNPIFIILVLLSAIALVARSLIFRTRLSKQ